MSQPFEDVLDRLDFGIGDFEDFGDMINLLHNLLGRMPTGLQIAVAHNRAMGQRAAATERGFSVTSFFRRGERVTQIRDARGRFLTSGARNITDLLEGDFDEPL